MCRLIKIIDQGDVCNLGFVVLLLVFAGGQVVDECQKRIGLALAGIVLVAYALYGFHFFPPHDASALFHLTLRSFLAAGLMLGAAWIVVPLASAIGRVCLSLLWEVPGRRVKAARQSLEAKRAAEADRLKKEEEWRHQEAAEAAARKASQPQPEAKEEQMRRENARLDCENLFSMLEPEIGSRFGRAAFDAYVAKYLHDSLPPELVEQRAVAFRQLLQQHRDGPGSGRSQNSIEGVTQWYLDQKAKIEALPVEDETREDLLRSLDERFDEKIKHLMENL